MQLVISRRGMGSLVGMLVSAAGALATTATLFALQVLPVAIVPDGLWVSALLSLGTFVGIACWLGVVLVAVLACTLYKSDRPDLARSKYGVVAGASGFASIYLFNLLLIQVAKVATVELTPLGGGVPILALAALYLTLLFVSLWHLRRRAKMAPGPADNY